MAVYRDELDADGQLDFNGKAKGFVRSYASLVQILPYDEIGWEMMSIVLNFLVPNQRAPIEEDLSRGILDVIDMGSYRVEKWATEAILLEDEDAEIDPTPASGGGYIPEPDMDPRSVILEESNGAWGTEFTDADQVGKLIAGIPERVEAKEDYQNSSQHPDEENARVEHDRALEEEVRDTIQCGAELYKLYTENEDFRRWLSDSSFSATYRQI